jgi:hypothetical protein
MKYTRESHILMTYVPRSTSTQAHDFTEDATTAARGTWGLHVNEGPCFPAKPPLLLRVEPLARHLHLDTFKIGLSTLGSIGVFHESCYSRSILNGEIGKG